MPFQRLKVRLKKEIVTLGDASVDPTQQVGIYVEPADWNALIAEPDTLVIDTRNAFEVAMGTFEGAIDPGITELRAIQGICRATTRSGETQEDRDVLHRRHPLREGERFLLARGFGEVYHLKGGILKYLEGVPEAREPLARRMLCVRRARGARPRPARAANTE